MLSVSERIRLCWGAPFVVAVVLLVFAVGMFNERHSLSETERVVEKTRGEGTLWFRVVSDEATLTFGNLVEPTSSCRFRYHASRVEVWN